MRSTVLTKDCSAILVPHGESLDLPAGTLVEVMQACGGSITLHVAGKLLRIEACDFDALDGENINDQFYQKLITPTTHLKPPIYGLPQESAIWQALRQCFDPEISVNIVDLGLIYACNINNNAVTITMTLTAPGCGMGPILIEDIKKAVNLVDNVSSVDVELVFEPPWSRDLISQSAKLELGLL